MSVLSGDRHRLLIQSIVMTLLASGCSSKEPELATENSIPTDVVPIPDAIVARTETDTEPPAVSTIVADNGQDDQDRTQKAALPKAPTVAEETLSLKGETLLVECLAAKAKPVGVASGVLGFTGPTGDGRYGANGVFQAVAAENRNDLGTQLRCRFMQSRSGRWLQLIHPFHDGHVLVTVRTNRIFVRPGGLWPGYGGDSNYPVTELNGHDAKMPLKSGVYAEIRSRVFSDGRLEVAVDGQPIATSIIDVVSPLRLPDGFKGPGLPKIWPVGSVGVIVGPRDTGDVVAENVRLEWITEDLAPPALTAEPKQTTVVENKPAEPVKTLSAKSPSGDAEGETGKPAVPEDVKIKLDTPQQPVVAIWELVDRKVGIRLALFADGTSSHGYRWSPVSRTKLELHDGTGDIKNNGLIVKGRWKGGSPFVGQLVTSNCWISGTISPVTGKVSVDDELSEFEKGLIGDFQLNGTNRRLKQNFSLPVTIVEDHRILDRDRTIATWQTDKTTLVISFLDTTIGAAKLSPTNRNDFRGVAKPNVGKTTWVIEMQRVKRVAVWETDQYGDVVLYSNGRTNDPVGQNSIGPWWLENSRLNLNYYECTLDPGGRTFTGRGTGGVGIRGILTSKAVK